MKCVWYLLFLMIVSSIMISCSEDDEKPATLRLEQRNLWGDTFSFSLYVDESVEEGVVYSTIQEDSEAALTATDVKQHTPKLQMDVKGGGPYIGNFSGLDPKTGYVVYAVLEVDGKENGMTTMKITTP